METTLQGDPLMVATTENLLGVGLYTTREAAYYAQVSPHLVTRWFYTDPVLESGVDIPEQRLITFADFIQLGAIRTARKEGVSLAKIKQALTYAKELGIDRPLARKYGEVWHIVGKNIVFRSDPDSEKYYQASGRSRGNLVIPAFVEIYQRKISFDETFLATQIRPYNYKNWNILLDPEVRFGEPIIEDSGYTVKTLWSAVSSEGGIERAADVFGVEIDAVEAACNYVDHYLEE